MDVQRQKTEPWCRIKMHKMNKTYFRSGLENPAASALNNSFKSPVSVS